MSRSISIIIPSRSMKDDISGLLDDISRQKTDFSTETIRITGVAPVAKARNDGAKQAKGDILIFIDCDIRLGNEFYLANLVKLLDSDKTLGAVCATLRLPPDAGVFQKRVASQIAHYENPIARQPTEISMASSACFAMPRELFLLIGGFEEKIIRGEDSELSYRIIRSGYRIMMAPETWCYHAAPDNLLQLILVHLRNGAGVAFVDTFYPSLNIDLHPEKMTQISSAKTKGQRLRRFLCASLKAVFEFKLLLLTAKFFYALGYLGGVLRYKVFKLGCNNSTS